MLARRYAKAIFDLASEQGALDKVGADLRAVSAAMKESAELSATLSSPAIRRGDRRKVVDALLKGMRADAEADKARILANAEKQAAATKRDAELRIAAEIERARQAVHARDSVTGREHGAGLGDRDLLVVVLDLLADDVGNLCGANIHDALPYLLSSSRRLRSWVRREPS